MRKTNNPKLAERKRALVCRTGIVCACAILIFTTQAQDIHFSQFYEAPMLRNPALAGLFKGDLRFQMVYRNQWAAVTVPYQTGSFNGEYKMPVGKGDDFLTVGGEIAYDKAGTTDFTTLQILPVVNYHKSLSGLKNRYLSLGFMGGYVQRSIDRSKITTDSQFDGTGYNAALGTGETLINYSLGYWDGSVGVSYNTGFGDEENERNNLFVGVAYHHFNRPKNSFYRNPGIELNPKVVFSAGVTFSMTDYSSFTIHADHSNQGSYTENIGGVLYTMGLDDILDNSMYNLSVGGFIRWGDAIIPVVKLDYKPFSIALSYDINTSQLKTASQGQGGFELSITNISFFDRANSTKNAVRCPRF
jgi:type IX secretion system PorP/SprF family membrane protein